MLKASKTQIVLADADGDGAPDRDDDCPAAPNPDQLDFDADLLGDACDPDDDNDLLADALDCAPFDASQGTPAEVASLGTSRLPGGTAQLAWTSAARADTYDLSRGLVSSLRASGNYGACLQSMLSALSYDDPDSPPAADSFFYMVRGHDAGCGGGGPLGSSSSGTPRPSPCP